jgi:ATP-dependent DNA helicase Rep
MQLNEQQQAAVSYTRGPLLVVAGAGSGKTRVIIEKIVHLVQNRGLPPARVAAITFTNKAAREMRERLARRLGATRAAEVAVSTFHALGWRVLREHHELLARPGIIPDEQDSLVVVRDLPLAGTAPKSVWPAQFRAGRTGTAGDAAGLPQRR